MSFKFIIWLLYNKFKYLGITLIKCDNVHVNLLQQNTRKVRNQSSISAAREMWLNDAEASISGRILGSRIALDSAAINAVRDIGIRQKENVLHGMKASLRASGKNTATRGAFVFAEGFAAVKLFNSHPEAGVAFGVLASATAYYLKHSATALYVDVKDYVRLVILKGKGKERE